jgi:HlyD family secretion protein
MKIKSSKIILSIPIIIVLSAIIIWASGINTESKFLVGVVEVDEVDVASKIPGRVEQIMVSEGEKVSKGQVLAKLESKELDAKVGQAQGVLDAVKNKLAMVNNGARPEEKKAVENLYLQAKHQFEYASKTWERFNNLLRDSVISNQEFDEIDFKYKAAENQMEAAKAKYDMVLKGAREEEKSAIKGQYDQAQSAYNEALAYYEELEIKSTINGEVSNSIVNNGEVIASGFPLFTVINPDAYYVVIQVREDNLGGLKMGEYLTGTMPALDNNSYKFKITYMSPMGDFATWKPTNQKGDFDLKTFKVHLKSDEPIENARPGMTVKIEL